MSYINPYMLAALAAAAIPLILHLLNLQKVEKIEFSSIMLLKEIRKSRFRKLRIKQFLLMLLRMLAIIFLVLAFADPYIKNITGKGSDVKRTAIIFTDSSYSMNAVEDSLKISEEAEKISGSIPGLFSSSDNLIKVHTSVPAGDSLKKNVYGPGLNSILRAINELSGGKAPDEVYVVSDLQKINFETPVTAKEQNLTETNFYFIDASNLKHGNVSVNNVYVDTRIPGPGGSVRVRVAVKNEGDNFVQDARLKISARGELKAEKIIELKPGERKEESIEFVPGLSGDIQCRAEISGIEGNNNSFREDDCFNFRVYIPDKIRIGILRGSASDTKYLASVFDAANAGAGKNVYDYTILTKIPEVLDYDMIYSAGYSFVTPQEKDIIKKFLDEGKGIFIFPSGDFNGEFLSKYCSVNLGNKTVSRKSIKLADVRVSEPLFQGMFRGDGKAEPNIKPVSVNSYYSMTSSGNSYPLIVSEDRNPFIVLDRTNYGPVIVSAVSADETMSDFPMNEIFAPLVLRSALFLSYPSRISGNTDYNMNHDTLESVTVMADKSYLDDIIPRAGIKNYEVVEKNELKNLESVVNEKRKGKSLWVYSVIVVLLLLASELILIRKVYERKE